MTAQLPTYRVLFVGLDGGTWRLLRPWIDQGHLPTLRRLMAEGTWGPLNSTLIPHTPLAWTSMVTGVRPGKHGIFGFIKRRAGTYEKELTTSLDRRRAALWTLLDRVGKRSIILDVPLTFPPDPISGVMITGLGTPGLDADFVRPAGLKDRIIRDFGPYELDLHFSGDVRTFIDDAVRMTAQRVALAEHLLREHAWELFMMVLTTTDRLQHVIWKYIDPGCPGYDARAAAEHLPAIVRFYQCIDGALARLLALTDERTVVVVASDHGFEGVHTKVALTRWLASQRLVVLGSQRWVFHPAPGPPPFTTRGGGRVDAGPEVLAVLRVDTPSDYAGVVFELRGLRPSSTYDVRVRIAGGTTGATLDITDLSRAGGQIIGGASLDGGPTEVRAPLHPQTDPTSVMVAMTTYGGHPSGHILLDAVTVTEVEDWTRTSVYILDAGEAGESRRLRVNLQGREAHGIIAPGDDYERLLSQLDDGLRRLTDAATGRSLVAEVYREADVFAGPCWEDAGDLLVILEEGVGGMRTFGSTDYEGPVSYPAGQGFSGKHAMDGILLMAGPPVRQGAVVGANIVDVCPTLLHLLGVPAPDDLDGRVLREAFTPDFLEAAPVRVASAPAGLDGAGSSAEGYTDQQRRQVEERLRRLGYIE